MGANSIDESMLLAPLRWKKPRMIFVCSMTDLFADFVKDEWIDKMFAVMALCPQHTFQVLTKRAERMKEYCTARHIAPNIAAWQAAVCAEIDILVPDRTDASRAARDRVIAGPLPNVWLGISAERQQEANERIPELLQTPAAVRFISAEPLLGSLDLTLLRGGTLDALSRLDWVICGGESGPNARPMHPDWARSLRDQCAEAGVAFFMKQMAKEAPIPDDLLVREFPQMPHDPAKARERIG